jgi:hypothetical protein
MVAIERPQLEGHLLAGVAHRIAERLQVALTELHRLQRQVDQGRPLSAEEFVMAIKSVREAGEANTRMIAFFFGHPDPAGVRPQDINAVVHGVETLLRCSGRPGLDVTFHLEPRLPLALADSWTIERDLLRFVLANQRSEPACRLVISTSTVSPLRGQPVSKVCITAHLERDGAFPQAFSPASSAREAFQAVECEAISDCFGACPARGPHRTMDETGLERFYFPIESAARSGLAGERRSAEA